MSGAGSAARPRLPFCWVCSRHLRGNFHRVAVVDGNEVVVHASCAERENLAVKDGAHLASRTAPTPAPRVGSEQGQ